MKVNRKNRIYIVFQQYGRALIWLPAKKVYIPQYGKGCLRLASPPHFLFFPTLPEANNNSMETCTDDNIFAIASFLLPKDLFVIALVSKRFGWTSNDTSTSKSPSTKRRQKQAGGWPWSLMEEASRRRVASAKNSSNNPWRDSDLLTIGGKEESWMAVDQRLYLLQSSLAFSKIIGSAISHVNGDITHIQGRERRAPRGFSVAICQEVMKSGKHHAEFTITKAGTINIGIMRHGIHGWSGKRITHSEYSSYCKLQREGGDPGYVGDFHQWYYSDENNYLRKGDKIGMQLDFESGILTVYRNGKYRTKTSRLTGHYSWAVTMGSYGSNRPSVRIGKAQNN